MSEQTGRLLAAARRQTRAQVSSGHLLLGALDPDGENVLRRINLDVDLDEIREHVRVLTSGPSDPHARLSDRVKRVLTEQQSTRDVLVALFDDPESTAARALVRMGLDLADLRACVQAMQNGRRMTKVARQLNYAPPPTARPIDP